MNFGATKKEQHKTSPRGVTRPFHSIWIDVRAGIEYIQTRYPSGNDWEAKGTGGGGGSEPTIWRGLVSQDGINDPVAIEQVNTTGQPMVFSYNFTGSYIAFSTGLFADMDKVYIQIGVGLTQTTFPGNTLRSPEISHYSNDADSIGIESFLNDVSSLDNQKRADSIMDRVQVTMYFYP
jgi:hypothetical protein